MNKKQIFAYCAGYTDGDGCFNLRKTILNDGKKIKYQGSFIISSTDLSVLNFFVKGFKGYSLLSSTREKYPGQKPQYHYSVYGKDALRLTEKIHDYLVEKRTEATIFRLFLEGPNDDRDYLIDQMKGVKEQNDLVYPFHKEQISKVSRTIIPTEEDFAYLAGFIDAECNISISRYKGKSSQNWLYKIILQCNNTKIPTIKWCMERFGGQLHFIDRKTKNPKHRNQITWRLSSKSLFPILKNIYPFLRFKKPVCQELMKFYETTKNLTMSRNNKLFTEHYRPILEERDKIFHQVQFLNRKGI